MTFYVYELVDPRDGVVFYVGKGKGPRINHHEAEARRGKQSRKCDRIRAIHAAGLFVRKRKVAFYADEDEAYLAEWALIQAHDNLTNDARYCQRAGSRAKRIADAEWVRGAAELANRSRNGTINVNVAGFVLKLDGILQTYISKASEAISRHGLGWANKIAAKYSVRFADGAAL